MNESAQVAWLLFQKAISEVSNKPDIFMASTASTHKSWKYECSDQLHRMP